MAERKSSVIFELKNRIGGPLRQITRQVKRNTRQMGAHFRNVRQRAAALGRGIAGLSVAAGGAIAALTTQFASNARQTGIWADRLGIGVRDLSRLEAVAARYDVQQDALIDGLKELSIRTDDYTNGAGGSAAEAFQRLGLSQKELNETSGDTAKLFEVVSARLRQVQNVAARQRLADEIFGGQGGEQMVEFLSASAAEVQRFGEQAERAGNVLNRGDIGTVNEYFKQWRQLQNTFGGIRKIIGSALLPIIGDLMRDLRAFIADNRAQITQWTQEFAQRLPARIQSFVAGVRGGIGTLQSFVDTMGGWKVALSGVALIISAPLLTAISQLLVFVVSMSAKLKLLTAAQWLFNAALAANPIGLAITAIAGLVAGILVLRNNWSTVTALFDATLGWLGGLFGNLADIGKRAFGSLVDAAHGAMAGLGDWADGVWSRIRGGVGQASSAVGSGISDLARTVRGAWGGVTEALGFDPLAVVRPLWQPIKGYLSAVMATLRRLISGDWSALMDLFRMSPLGMIQRAFQGVIDWLSGLDWREHGKRLIQTLVDGIKSLATLPARALRSALSGVRDLLPFSDARTGPLAQLTRSGRSIADTLASGVTARRGHLVSAVRRTAAAARAGISDEWRDLFELPTRTLRAATGQPGQAQGANSAGTAPAGRSLFTARPGAQTVNTQVGGLIRIELDSNNQPRVREVTRTGPVDFDIDTGPATVGAG